jgi:hypothetical protein
MLLSSLEDMPLDIVYLIVDCLAPRDFVAFSSVSLLIYISSYDKLMLVLQPGCQMLSKVVERPNHLEKAVPGIYPSATAWSS